MRREPEIWHGGDLDEAGRLFPHAPEPWIDLSTGINPVPYTVPELTPALFERLPSPGAIAGLEAAAARAYRAAPGVEAVAAPGTQVLISVLPYLRPPSRVTVLSPTYAEHARAWEAAGHRVSPVGSLAEAAGAEVIVVVNPNNPDGRVTSSEALLEAAEALSRRGGWLVVDEAFADFDPGASLAPFLPDGAVVLRSFGKTYGLAGLRLGFALAHPPLAARIRGALGPWAVSGPAVEIGRRALGDEAWLAAAARARRADAARLSGLLDKAAGAASAGTALYRTILSPRAPDLFRRLGEAGIWTRRFQDEPRRLRLGLPGTEETWERLAAALAA